jgi:hypothetical protein
MLYIYDRNGNSLFHAIGSAIGALETAYPLLAITIPRGMRAFAAQVERLPLSDLTTSQALAGLGDTVTGFTTSGTTLAYQAQAVLNSLITAWAAQFEPPDTGLSTALKHLVAAMETAHLYVQGNNVVATVSADPLNVGSVELLVTTRRGDGRTCEFALSEQLTAVVSSESDTSPSIQISGPAAASGALGVDWPAGSGLQTTLTATGGTDSGLLAKGSFSTWDGDLPQGWVVAIGTPGRSVRQALVATQRVHVSDTATGGVYYLVYTDRWGVRRSTAALEYNATASDVQAALAALPGLEEVTVSAWRDSATIHQVAFTGLGGRVDLLEVIDHVIGGGVSIELVQPGDAGSATGQSLRIDGDGVELTTLYASLSGLSADTVYFCHLLVAVTEATNEESTSTQSGTSSSSSWSSSSTARNYSTTSQSSQSTSSINKVWEPVVPYWVDHGEGQAENWIDPEFESSASSSTENPTSVSSVSMSSSSSSPSTSSTLHYSSTTSQSSQSTSSTSLSSSEISTSASSQSSSSSSPSSSSSSTAISTSASSASSASSSSEISTSLSSSSLAMSFTSTSTTTASASSASSQSSSSTSTSKSSSSYSSASSNSSSSSVDSTSASSVTSASDGCQGQQVEWQWIAAQQDWVQNMSTECPAGCRADPPAVGGEYQGELRYTTCYPVYGALAADEELFGEGEEEESSSSTEELETSQELTSESSSEISTSGIFTHTSASTASSASSSSTSSSESSTLSVSSSSSSQSTSSLSSSESSQSLSSSTEARESSSSSSTQFTRDLRVEIVDGIHGEVLADSSSTGNALAIDLNLVSGTQGFGFSFRLPQGVQQPVYLRLRLAAPLPAGYSLFVDDVCVVQGTELYAGGPTAAAFTGIRPAVLGDQWSIDVRNDRRGRLQEWFQRLFDLQALGLQLPTRGQNLIPSSVIVGAQLPEA